MLNAALATIGQPVVQPTQSGTGGRIGRTHFSFKGSISADALVSIEADDQSHP
jgi:hypothetical protein